MLHNRNVISLLKKLGLSRMATICYLASLTLGPAKISDIAKTARINRVNVYAAIEELTENGLVEQEITPTGRRVHPASLDFLASFAQDYQKQAARVRWKIADLIPKLATLKGMRTERPQIMFFEGEGTFTAVAERSLHTAPGSTILEIRPESKYEALGAPEAYDEEHYIPTRLERDLKIRVLAPRQWYEKMRHLNKNQQRDMRLLPKGWEITSETFIYDDEVGLIWKAVEPVGIVIKNKTIATLMRMLFETAWQTAGK